jgi:hypothetical protein
MKFKVGNKVKNTITIEPIDELWLQVNALRESIQRVRELHIEINGPADDRTCSACAVDEHNYPEYPCPTIKALDGDQ